MSSLSMSQPMQVLVSRNTAEWYTPPWIIERVYRVMPVIDLDPASDPIPQVWIQANLYYNKKDDGLSRQWFGNVFLNPPYNGSSARWTAKLIEEYESGRVDQAIMLINSAHGYKWYENLWTAYPVCCFRDRVRFVKPDGTTGGQAKKAQTAVYFGRDVKRFREAFGDLGRVLLP